MLLFMSIAVFLILRLVPGDPVRTMLGLQATPQSIAVAREQLGLNLPLPQQYLHWLGQLLHGNLGQDYASQEPVTSLIAAAFPVTRHARDPFAKIVCRLVGCRRSKSRLARADVCTDVERRERTRCGQDRRQPKYGLRSDASPRVWIARKSAHHSPHEQGHGF